MKNLSKFTLILSGILVTLCFISASGLEWKTHKTFQYQIDIPKGVEQKKAITTGLSTVLPVGVVRRFEFEYSDGSMVYVHKGKHFRMPNEENYKSIGWSNDGNKTKNAVIEGVQQDGTLWKEVHKGKVVIGYKNVPVSQKEIYDKALNSFRK